MNVVHICLLLIKYPLPTDWIELIWKKSNGSDSVPELLSARFVSLIGILDSRALHENRIS